MRPAPVPVSTVLDPRRTLLVSEVFGPTFQGEGPSLGRRCSFLRLGGCNLHCAWCDTAYTWDWTGRNGIRYDPRTELRRATTAELWQDLASRGTDALVVSGGEPLLQQQALLGLARRCRSAGWWLEVETAGTISPVKELAALVDRFNVSPKLANSGNAEDDRHRPEALAALAATGKAAWKFVATGPADLDEVEALVERHGLSPVFIMPEGVTAQAMVQRSRELAADVLARGWNLTTRLHVLLHDRRRGV
jgi:7-carboxy-7-deazaguanine synthase